jgi:hypothetical protein
VREEEDLRCKKKKEERKKRDNVSFPAAKQQDLRFFVLY